MKKQPVKFLYPFVLSLFFAVFVTSCKNNQENESAEAVKTEDVAEDPFFKISLAQWSLSGPIMAGEMDPMDFAQKANEMGFEGIEYVSQLYTGKIQEGQTPEAGMQTVLDTLKARSERYNVENVLIMVDNEGELAATDKAERDQAIENHKKWVDAAEFLGAHAIRVNLFGPNDPEEWKKGAVDGLGRLAEYAAEKDINVLVENHGYLSSNAALLVEVMNEIDLENAGTLPDFGNFCLQREGGERWEAACIEEYPKYQGVEEMMPHAKAVSAKSYDFNEEGEETTIDYGRMLQIVKDAGYTGYIGVEYEGQRLSPEEGIKATRELLIEKGSKLNN